MVGRRHGAHRRHKAAANTEEHVEYRGAQGESGVSIVEDTRRHELLL